MAWLDSRTAVIALNYVPVHVGRVQNVGLEWHRPLSIGVPLSCAICVTTLAR